MLYIKYIIICKNKNTKKSKTSSNNCTFYVFFIMLRTGCLPNKDPAQVTYERGDLNNCPNVDIKAQYLLGTGH